MLTMEGACGIFAYDHLTFIFFTIRVLPSAHTNTHGGQQERASGQISNIPSRFQFVIGPDRERGFLNQNLM